MWHHADVANNRRCVLQYPLDEVLLSLHNYFATLGSVEVRRLSAENDKPLRMVKTVLHTLCKIFGYRVTHTLDEIPEIRSLGTGSSSAMIVMYADINLRSLVDLGMIAAPTAAAPDAGAGFGHAPVPGAVPGRISPTSPGSGSSPGHHNGAAVATAHTSPSSRSGRSSGGASPLPPPAPRPASPAPRPPPPAAPQPQPAASPTPPAQPPAAEADVEDDDLARQPDHFLNRISRRSGADGPQPLQSSNTVNMAAGGAGPAMGDDLREKVCCPAAAP